MWLTIAASHAIERLMEARHPVSLGSASLAILHKLAIARRSGIGSYDETKFQFSTLVPAWPELNRASFWFEVGKARDGLTEFWQVYDSFCQFEKSDFEYAVEQIAERSLLDEKLLALSLAFYSYVKGGRDRRQRNKLKKVVAGHSVLAERLTGYLKPPARGRQSWKRLEAKHKRRSEAMKRKESRNRDKWRTFLRANADKLRNNGLKPGELSGHQWYVHECARKENDRSGRWTGDDWRCLTEEFGDEVARAYRDGAIRFWREYEPRLQSEGAPANETPYAVIFGLTGLQIEANETSGWPVGLSQGEVELACRYAAHELNGFPTWFPTLFVVYPSIVREFLLKEIR
ncbi:MAG TPA: hypothetical protein VN437_05080, partial [Rectinemataceae bacterium]|nr:hypothetical protein [Rectinemataceae bacterium]